MRTILRYVSGKAEWSDNVPSSPGPTRLGGSIVVGDPGAQELARIAHRKLQKLRQAEKA